MWISIKEGDTVVKGIDKVPNSITTNVKMHVQYLLTWKWKLIDLCLPHFIP